MQRHSHTYFCEEPTGFFAACYEVSKRCAGDGSLRLERRSSQPRNGGLRFKCRSVGDGSQRFGRRSPQLRHYSGDRSLRLGHRSSQPRHGGLCTKRRPPQPRAAQYSDCCACTSLLSARVSYSCTSRPCGGGSSFTLDLGASVSAFSHLKYIYMYIYKYSRTDW